MSRQHAVPILLPSDGSAAQELTPLALMAGPEAVSEAAIQQLIFAHPNCLPIREIDPLFCNPVPLCMELNTPAGPIDALMVTASGLPVLVECKLWRNPEGRREVVGQILDYAKELSRWSSSDLQREVSRRLKREGNALLDLVREAGHEVDEIEFNDALTLNLRRGRFLLLIVGDGIREGVEAITEYLQAHAGLHFTLGLVELPIYALADGGRIIAPRVLVRTKVITRDVVATPEGFMIKGDVGTDAPPGSVDDEMVDRLNFVRELTSTLELKDPDQPLPKPTPRGYLFLYMPAPKSTCWINVSVRANEIGLWLTANKDTAGDAAVQRLAEDWGDLAPLLGGNAKVQPWRNDPRRFWIVEVRSASPFGDIAERDQALAWLRERIDTWVSILRPRVRTIIDDLQVEDR